MKASELRELSPEELETEIHRLKEELFSLNFKHKAQPLSNPLKLRTIRRDIARAITIQSDSSYRESRVLKGKGVSPLPLKNEKKVRG